MKRVLVTGGKGFLGSRFSETQKNIFSIDAPGSKEMNILDEKQIHNRFDRFRPDYVLHAAALPFTDYCNRNPGECHDVNVLGTEFIARACREWGSRMIFISTEQVFNGNRERGPYRENDMAEPDTVYGMNKLEAEKVVVQIVPDALILRLTWLFGVEPGNLLSETVDVLKNNQPVTVPVNEYRGLTSVDELMENFPALMKLPPGLYHTGSENNMNRYETVCFILRELGAEDHIIDLVREDREKYSNCPRDVRLNTGKLKEAGISFLKTEESLRRCISRYGLRSR